MVKKLNACITNFTSIKYLLFKLLDKNDSYFCNLLLLIVSKDQHESTIVTAKNFYDSTRAALLRSDNFLWKE